MRAFLLAFLLLISLQLPADAAARFWVGGTGDCSDTAHWAASSGAAGGQTVPGSSDTATWDGASGGGTVTCTGPFTWQSMTWGAFTGTLNMTGDFGITGTASSAFSGSGSGTRTFNAGNGTYTISSADPSPLSMTTTTNLTFNAQGSTFVIAGSSNSLRSLTTDNITWNNVTIAVNSGRGPVNMTGPTTISGTLTLAEGTYITGPSAGVWTVTNLLAQGTSASPVLIECIVQSSTTSIVSSGLVTIANGMLRGMAFSGGGTFTTTNVYDGGTNSGIVINPPQVGGGSGIFGG